MRNIIALTLLLMVYAAHGQSTILGRTTQDRITMNLWRSNALYQGINWYNVRQWGAVGDGENNDTAALTNALWFAHTNDWPVKLYIPEGIYHVTGELPVDIAKTSITSEGATIEHEFMTNGNVMRFYGSADPPDKQGSRIVEGLFFYGGGTPRPTNLITMLFDTQSDGYTCLNQVRNIAIWGAGKAISIGNNGFTLHFNNVTVSQSRYGVYMPYGVQNAGERILFNGCAFFNMGGIAVHNGNPNGQLQFVGCAFDYNHHMVECVSGGRVNISQSHIETKEAVATNSPWKCLFYVRDNDSYLSIRDSVLQFVNWPEGGQKLPYIILCDTAGAYGALFENNRTANLYTTNGMFAGGTGLVEMRGSHSWLQSYQPLFLGTNNSLWVDGSFENAGTSPLISDMVWIMESSAGTISNKWSSYCGTLYPTNGAARTGTNSLCVNKTGGSGSSLMIVLAAPLRHAGQCGADSYLSQPDTSHTTDNIVYVRHWWARVDPTHHQGVNTPQITFWQPYDDYQTITNTAGTPLSWTRSYTANGHWYRRSPAWATHFVTSYNFSINTVAQKYYIDDVYFSEH